MATDKSKQSQCNMILQDLLACKLITPIDALNRYGCFRLASRIWDLRERGIEIECTKVEQNGKTFAGYFMTAGGAQKYYEQFKDKTDA